MTATPDELAIGTKLTTATGAVVWVAQRTGEDKDGYARYRLKYRSGVLGRETWTVDELIEAGVNIPGGREI